MIRFASLGSGSAGNALLVERGTTCLMLDCGFGLRDTLSRLQSLQRSPADISGILLTHEHGDHVGGAYRFARKFAIPVWLTHGTWVASRESEQGLDLRIIDAHRPLNIGDLEVQPFPVPHDAREPVQYVFSGGGRRLGVLTDVGAVTSHVCAMLSACDGLVLEFNHDAGMLERSSYPASLKRRIAGRFGHLENAAAIDLLRQIDCSRLQHLVAAHLSERNNSPDTVRRIFSESRACQVALSAIASADLGFDWLTLT